jgi:phosphatidylserine decarboxylase
MRIPVAVASFPYLLASGAVALLALWGWRHTAGHPVLAVAALAAVAVFFCLAWFFRDPERRCRLDAGLILSPADGVVRRVHSTTGGRQVEIFMAVWNVHIQRAPVTGKVESVKFTKGSYFVAYDERAGKRNTRCASVFSSSRGRIGMLQVAGAIARKVEFWRNAGDRVSQGTRVGIIHLGSQVRVALPRGARVLVHTGDRVRGGLTPIAKWR